MRLLPQAVTGHSSVLLVSLPCLFRRTPCVVAAQAAPGLLLGSTEWGLRAPKALETALSSQPPSGQGELQPPGWGVWRAEHGSAQLGALEVTAVQLKGVSLLGCSFVVTCGAGMVHQQ